MTDEFPPAFLACEPPPVAAPEAPEPPACVAFEDYRKVVDATLALVGTSATAVYDEGFTVTTDRISYITCVPVPGIEPIVIACDDLPEAAEWGWPVTVPIVRTDA